MDEEGEGEGSDCFCTFHRSLVVSEFSKMTLKPSSSTWWLARWVPGKCTWHCRTGRSRLRQKTVGS